MNIKKDILNIINWFTKAVEKLLGFVKNANLGDAAALLEEIKDVINAYLDVCQQIMPDNAMTPFPSNFFSRITWLTKNISWLKIVSLGSDPFEKAKEKAEAVASKWGFFN